MSDPNLKIRYFSRAKVMNPSPERMPFSAHVSAFGAYEATGEGLTKRQAYENAIDNLPAHIRRHFVSSDR